MSARDPRLDIEGLYRTHRAEVYRLALRKLGDHHEAEDVTQTAFLDAYRAMLRGSHPELPRAWLLAIAENVRRRRFRPAVRSLREEPLRDDFAALDSEARELAETIRIALGQLATTQRHAFLLRELGGLSYSEIAAKLEISVPSVQMLLFRARQKLRAELGSAGLGALLGPQAIVGLASRLAGSAAAPKVAVAVAVTAVAGSVERVELKPTVAPPTASAQAAPASPVRAHPAAASAEPRTVRARSPRRPVARAKQKPAQVQAPARRVSRPAPASPRAEPAPAPAATVASPPPPPPANGAEPVVRVAPSTTPGSDDEAPAPLLSPIVTSEVEVPIVSAAVPVQPSLPSAPVEAIPVLPDVVIVPPLPPPPDVAEELVPEEVGSSLVPG